ncbi:MAG: hypothetical protein V4734_10295, partial [Terriglobus sp.]
MPQLRVAPDAIALTPETSEAQPEMAKEKTRLDWAAALRMTAIVATVGAIAPSLFPGAVSSGSAGGLS